MKNILYVICMSLLPFSIPIQATAETVRNPAVAGGFYPASREAVVKELNSLAEKAEQTPLNIPKGKVLKALIMPHAGWVFSGWTAAHAARVLKTSTAERIILMGPDHRVGLRNGAISDVDAYETPLGKITLNKDAKTLLQTPDLFQSSQASDRSEHSLEVILPFLQHFHPSFELIPIVVGIGDIGRMTKAIETLADDKTLIVVSSDLSHFMPYADAAKKDRETIRLITALDDENLLKDTRRACGILPVVMLIRLARQFGWQPVELHYSNSGDTAGDRSGVVGYTTIAFFGDSPMTNPKQTSQAFTDEQGQTLVKLARQTIMQRLGRRPDEAEAKKVETALKDKAFEARRGTFVTLTINHQLRGCIGSLVARESVDEGVRSNALNAAFSDYRFNPLTVDELDRVAVEVSILTDPQPLAYKDAADLIAKLRPKIDGLIIRKGPHSATFLPQVWDQLPKVESFLGHLCAKAGLPQNAWKDGKLEVMTYQVQYFEEHR